MSVAKPVISLQNVSLTIPFKGKKVDLLKNINLDLYPGERIGVIGKNGAGKSVLLKVASQIYEPTTGTVQHQGNILSLFKVSSGENRHWTGRENAEIKLLMYGVKPADVPKYIEDIQAFAQIGEYFDTPVKFYSAGMAARLSFAIISSIPAEVLVLDEWISVGDAAFKESAAKRFNQRVTSAGAVLFCTHSPDILNDWATKVIWVEQGQVKKQGETAQVLEEFHHSIAVES